MKDQSETERSSTTSHWFGFDRLRLSDDEHAIDVTIGAESHWDRSHLRRLRQSGDLPGMVPIIDSDFSADGKPFAITPVVDAPSLSSLIEAGELDWTSGAGITEAAARAAHEAHLRGLFHGALSPDDVFLVGDDVAIGGVGLGLGGTPPADRFDWVAPEVRDGAEPTERSDVYSLGKILEASLGDALDTVPRSIRRLIMWSSSDTPEARPPSTMEFASILAEGLGDDRKTYPPAFIPTAGASELASRASSAVSNHTPSDVAQSTASAAGLGMMGAGAAAAAFLGQDDPDPADDGFSLTEADYDDADPGVDFDADDGEMEIELEEVFETEDIDLDQGAGGIETETASVAAKGGLDFTEEPETYSSSSAAETVDLDETYIPRRRNRAGLVIASVLGLGLALIAWGILRSGDDDVEIADVTDTAESADSTPSTVDEEAESDGAEADGTDGESDGAESDGADDGEATLPATSVGSTTDSETESDADDGETDAGSTTGGDDDESTNQSTEATPTTDGPATSGNAGSSDSTSTEAETGEVDAGAEGSDDETSGSENSGSESEANDSAEVAVAKPPPPADGPIAMADAGIQVLHGVPGANVDVYVDGEAIATGFTSGTIAGPIAMKPGDYEVTLYNATDGAPASAEDRTDEPLMSKMVPVGSSAASVVAHLNKDGEVAISPFTEQLSPVDPGQGRVMIRHLMAAGEADATVGGTPIGSLTPGEETAVDVDAGSVLVEILGSDGEVLTKATVPVDDGELVSLTAIGSPEDGTADLVIQRYTGLDTAPAAVPTGDSGLLGLGNDNTGEMTAYGLMVVLALSGGLVALRRRRSAW